MLFKTPSKAPLVVSLLPRFHVPKHQAAFKVPQGRTWIIPAPRCLYKGLRQTDDSSSPPSSGLLV